MEDIGKRLERFVSYKARKPAEFANMVGWDRQYLNALMKGRGFGVKPIETLLRRFPELDARWLITGDGDMLNADYTEAAREEIRRRVSRLEKMDSLIPYMSLDQIRKISCGKDYLSDDEMRDLEEKSKNDTQKSTHT